MHDPAAGQRETGLDRVQLPVGHLQHPGLTVEDRAFVEHPRPFESFLRAHPPNPPFIRIRPPRRTPYAPDEA
ncbi:hypothetical protein GCM10018952_02050 [Streptosporangium vulgare]